MLLSPWFNSSVTAEFWTNNKLGYRQTNTFVLIFRNYLGVI